VCDKDFIVSHPARYVVFIGGWRYIKAFQVLKQEGG